MTFGFRKIIRVTCDPPFTAQQVTSKLPIRVGVTVSAMTATLSPPPDAAISFR
jgi:hypothetical protein